MPSLFAIQSLSAQVSLDKLAIEVRGSSREFSFTNKQDAFYYGETNADTRSSWQGFNVFGHEYLDDYVVMVDGKPLDRSQATAVVYPDYLKRVYPNGIVEELRLADTIPLFSVTVRSSRKPVRIEIVPLVTDGTQPQDFVVGHREYALVLARKAHAKRGPRENYPVWLAVSGKDFEADHTARTIGGCFAPFSMRFDKCSVLTIAFAVADDSPFADSLCQMYLANPTKYITQRRKRMEQLLNDSWVETEDKRFDKALGWAKLSLDALIMNQVTKGILAGLPWFNNYWGRDTFISLPGATLVTGRFSEAKEILRSFARYQQTDTNSTDYGRIPNIVTTTDKAYNTADGTPRFVMMAREYVERSGDSTFIVEIYPTILRSIEGTLLRHTDSLGFLTHEDAETWMDAVGPDGPWSPRGNRANDIQALWAHQLDAGIWFATQLGDVTSARLWHEKVTQLKKNFSLAFVSESAVADHLTSDGRKDIHLRPNQIFIGNLVDDSTRAGILRTVVSNLTYEYGVASLCQDDDNFHPYHQYEPYYPKDAAYHNGTVWTWVQGQVISELCRFRKEEVAAELTVNAVHQILDRGAVGTQSELLDAVPRPGEKEPRLSGTFSQAWNLAEFVRNFYDDYLGVEVNRYYHRLVLHPLLPKSLGKVKARINLGDRAFQIEIDQHSSPKTVSVKSPILRTPGKGVIIIPSTPHNIVTVPLEIESNSQISLTVQDTSIALVANGRNLPLPVNTAFKDIPSFDETFGRMAFATPKLAPGLRSLRGPDYPFIPHSRLKSTNPSAEILIDAVDPADDDVGTGTYTYPSHPHFKSGIFDLLNFTVSVDDSNVYFALKYKALSNPSWHPEYGFQLTYVAIAIDVDGIPNSGRRLIPKNANYMLDERHAFERLILIGGGVQMQDTSGKILAAYIPAAPDITNPLGNVHDATIAFAIPLFYLSKPDSAWTFTVLSGGQDDHGGAGIGEFRTVNKEPGAWNGGGRTLRDEPNIYDVVVAPRR